MGPSFPWVAGRPQEPPLRWSGKITRWVKNEEIDKSRNLKDAATLICDDYRSYGFVVERGSSIGASESRNQHLENRVWRIEFGERTSKEKPGPQRSRTRLFESLSITFPLKETGQCQSKSDGLETLPKTIFYSTPVVISCQEKKFHDFHKRNACLGASVR